MDEIKVDVLDKGHVTLLDHLGTDLTVVNSARVSYGKKKSEIGEDDIKLINFLAREKHDSPFRHVYLQFRVKAPEFVMRQWYKHVVGIAYTEQATVDHAWNEISGRYIEYEPDIYIPESFRKQSASNKQASTDESVPAPATIEYKAHVQNCFSTYKSLLRQGVAREQARLALPFGLYTEVIWTTSLQAVLNFIALRTHKGSQYEITQYAQAIKSLCGTVVPHSIKAWGENRG